MPDPLVDLDQARERIDRWTTPFEGHPHLGNWAVVTKVDNLVVGTLLLRPLADSDEIEIGWSLDRAHWGHGYATEAAAAALERAWQLGHPAVRAIMWPDNAPSAKVCERLGMTSLGVVVDPWHGTDEDPFSLMFRVERPD